MQIRSWSFCDDQRRKMRFLSVNEKHVTDNYGSVVGKGIVIIQLWLILL